MRIVKIEPLHALGDHDGEFTVGRVVHVVRIYDMNGLIFFPGRRIDPSDTVAVIGQHPKRLQIPGRSSVLRLPADWEVVDDFEVFGSIT